MTDCKHSIWLQVNYDIYNHFIVNAFDKLVRRAPNTLFFIYLSLKEDNVVGYKIF